MKTCHLRDIASLEQFYMQIAQDFGFPLPFERDADSLWDLLSEIEGPLRLVWENPRVSRDALEEDYWLLLEVLADAVAERGDFELVLR